LQIRSSGCKYLLLAGYTSIEDTPSSTFCSMPKKKRNHGHWAYHQRCHQQYTLLRLACTLSYSQGNACTACNSFDIPLKMGDTPCQPCRHDWHGPVHHHQIPMLPQL
jgi:hypothetical protein